MKKSVLLPLVVGLFATAHCAFAQFNFVGATVNNGTFELSACGCYANNTCTVSPAGTPVWTSQPMPATLTNGQSVTWGYADGSTGSLGGGTSDNSSSLANVSFRNVIRGANQNGGRASGIQCTTTISVPSVHCVIWGPFLDQFGLHGARSFHWTISQWLFGNPQVILQGDGEADVIVPHANASPFTWCTVTATDANENGSVIINFNM